MTSCVIVRKWRAMLPAILQTWEESRVGASLGPTIKVGIFEEISSKERKKERKLSSFNVPPILVYLDTATDQIDGTDVIAS